MGKWNHALNGNWSFRIVWIEGMNVPFSLTIPEFGYNRLFGKVMARERKETTRLDFGWEIWQGGSYDYRSSKRD